MTNEEAIVQLKYDRAMCLFNPLTGENEPINDDCKKTATAIEKAIEAIAKQIPQKPKIKDKDFVSYSYDCPCCEGYLVSVIADELCVGAKYEYCPKCGQKLDWSEE